MLAPVGRKFQNAYANLVFVHPGLFQTMASGHRAILILQFALGLVNA